MRDLAVTDAKTSDIDAQCLGRFAAVSSDGAPQVDPASCHGNPNHRHRIDIGGLNDARPRVFRSTRTNPRAAVVIDQMLPTQCPADSDVYAAAAYFLRTRQSAGEA